AWYRAQLGLRGAVAEPRDAARRDRRDPGARPGLREPRLASRLSRHDPPPLQREAMDRVPARIQRTAPPSPDEAGPLHGAVLPRRSDGVGGRPSPLRGMQTRRLRAIR